MGLLSRLLGKDLTADWPPAAGIPSLDLERHAVGPLRLGDPVEGARALGRPQAAKGDPGGGMLLDYGTYDLQFRDGRLLCAGFDMEAASQVTVAGFTLSTATTPLDAMAWLGEPTSDSQEGDLRWIDYERGEATLALEFDGGKLACVQLYAEGFA